MAWQCTGMSPGWHRALGSRVDNISLSNTLSCEVKWRLENEEFCGWQNLWNVVCCVFACCICIMWTRVNCQPPTGFSRGGDVPERPLSRAGSATRLYPNPAVPSGVVPARPVFCRQADVVTTLLGNLSYLTPADLWHIWLKYQIWLKYFWQRYKLLRSKKLSETQTGSLIAYSSFP